MTRLAYLVPERNYRFFRSIVPHLERLGIAVQVNETAGAEVVLAAMLPQTPEWIDTLEVVDRPVILWHWDQFAFVDESKYPWRAQYAWMYRAQEIWSATYEVARQVRQRFGLHSTVLGSWVDQREFAPPYGRGEHVLYAAPRSALHKRVNWVEAACDLLGVPFLETYQDQRGREEYVDIVRSARCYVMAAHDESNATIPVLEAAVCNKPILCSDLPAVREEMGDTVDYFPPNDFQTFLRQLGIVYGQKKGRARRRALDLFGIEVVAERMAVRIHAHGKG